MNPQNNRQALLQEFLTEEKGYEKFIGCQVLKAFHLCRQLQ